MWLLNSHKEWASRQVPDLMALRDLLQLASELDLQARINMSWPRRQAVAAGLVTLVQGQLAVARDGKRRHTMAAFSHLACLPLVQYRPAGAGKRWRKAARNGGLKPACMPATCPESYSAGNFKRLSRKREGAQGQQQSSFKCPKNARRSARSRKRVVGELSFAFFLLCIRWFWGCA
jgi:hypothetical protein